MIKLNYRIVCGVALLMLSGSGFAGEITRQTAEELMVECQRQRQEQIAPYKEKAIEDCITKRRRDRDYCESYNRNYGERTAGGTSAGMFWGLPVCEEAVAAEKYFRMNPGKKTYNTPW